MTRVLTLNLQRGLARDGTPTTPEQLTAALSGIDADIVALQEVDRLQPRSGQTDQASLAAAALGLPHWRFAASLTGDVRSQRSPATDSSIDGPAYGVAIASRWPIVASFVRPLRRLTRRHPVLARGRLRLASDEQRTLLAAVIRTPDGDLSIGCTHLSLLAPVAGYQVRSALAAMRTLPATAVLCGDLNLDPWAVMPLRSGWQLARGLTFPARAPRRQIDHVLVRGAAIARTQVLDLPISDHRGLLVQLARP